MGQKKGLVYNTIVIMILLGICYFTTSKSGYSAPDIIKIEKVFSPFNFEPLEVNIIFASEEKLLIPDGLKYAIENISNAFSQYFDLKVTLNEILSDNPKKIKNFSISAENTKSLIFAISPKFMNFHKENLYWIPQNDLNQIVSIFITFLRTFVKFPYADKDLINGLTQGELLYIEKFRKDWLKSVLFDEIQIYNKMNHNNQPIINKDLYTKITEINNKISKELDADELYIILRQMQELNSDIGLAQEEYFQWDFKLGVYAPLFFPVIFPMSAAIYSRLFLRR